MNIKKAQSTLEYALLIAIVVGALISMQNFIKRSLQGKLQAIGDQLGDPYSPGATKRVENTVSGAEKIEETTTFGAEGRTTTNITGGYQNTTSNRYIKNLNEEKWPTNK